MSLIGPRQPGDALVCFTPPDASGRLQGTLFKVPGDKLVPTLVPGPRSIRTSFPGCRFAACFLTLTPFCACTCPLPKVRAWEQSGCRRKRLENVSYYYLARISHKH